MLTRAHHTATCIANNCGQHFDKLATETRDMQTLRPFAMRYCPACRALPRNPHQTNRD